MLQIEIKKNIKVNEIRINKYKTSMLWIKMDENN